MPQDPEDYQIQSDTLLRVGWTSLVETQVCVLLSGDHEGFSSDLGSDVQCLVLDIPAIVLEVLNGTVYTGSL